MRETERKEGMKRMELNGCWGEKKLAETMWCSGGIVNFKRGAKATTKRRFRLRVLVRELGR